MPKKTTVPGPSGIPSPVVQRMARYLVYVRGLHEEGVKWVSSEELARAFRFTSSTVRQDFSHLDFRGNANRGYETEGLERVLSEALGALATTRLVIVGSGNLGRALALHRDFGEHGFEVVAIVDNDPRVIGRKIGALTVQGLQDLPEIVRTQNVDIGLITVPVAKAQEVADYLILSGVRGLLNFAAVRISAPPSVPVIGTRFITNLLELTHAVKVRRNTRLPGRAAEPATETSKTTP